MTPSNYSGIAPRIDGERHRTICEALLNGYRTIPQLRIMTKQRLDINLDEVTPTTENLEIVTFELIDWADRTGKICDLILGAHKHNPDNVMLKALAGMLRTWTDALESSGELLQSAMLGVSTTNSQWSTDNSLINPFYVGGAVPLHLFFGRKRELKWILGKLAGVQPQSVSIVADRRIGKSSILRYITENIGNSFIQPQKSIVIYVDFMRAAFQNRPGLMRYLREKLSLFWREPWNPGDDGHLEALDFALEELSSDGIRLILCLDEIGQVANKPNEFNDLLEDLRANGQSGMLAMVTASTDSLANICQANGLTSPFYNIFNQCRVGFLEYDDWVELLKQNMQVTDTDIIFVDRLAGGHPFYTQMVAAQMWEMKREGEVEYEKLFGVLREQMTPHLQSLWSNLTEPEQTTLRQIIEGAPINHTQQIEALKHHCILNGDRVFTEILDSSIMDV